jgi:hypothetical protein
MVKKLINNCLIRYKYQVYMISNIYIKSGVTAVTKRCDEQIIGVIIHFSLQF